MTADERALLAQVAEGDQQALKCLYALYRPQLWAYLWRMLNRDAEWTEELVQDVFLVVWRSAKGYRGDAQIRAWLFRIAHNLALNAVRARGRRPQTEPLLGDDDHDGVGAPSAPSFENPILDRLALTAALDGLSPNHREVLDLAFVQGFTAEEIGAILSVPVGTVKSRMSYARRALQARLARENTAEESGRER